MLKIGKNYLALFEESTFDLILTDTTLQKFKRYKNNFGKISDYPRKEASWMLRSELQNYYNEASNSLFWISSPFAITRLNLGGGDFMQFDIYSKEFIAENLPVNLKVVGTSKGQVVVLTALRSGLFICYHYQNETGGVTEIYKIEDCILGGKMSIPVVDGCREAQSLIFLAEKY